MSQPETVLLRAENISKSFGAMRALDDVSLVVRTGEVHGLLGANGAGKSTLIGVLSGAVRPDQGRLLMAGREVRLGSLAAARRAGLTIVHQELMLFPDLTVEENIFATALPAAPCRFIGRRGRRRQVEAALHRLGARVDLRRRVGELPLPQRQMVEVARALCSGGTVLVLDEPTSALSEPEARGLFQAIRAIVAHDAAVVFVSHRLDEVFAITDRLTVLRDGRVEGRWRTADADIATITSAMVGALADARRPHRVVAGGGAPVLAVRGSAPGVADLDMSLSAGEIVGLAGLEGSGVATVMRMLGGIVPVAGRVEFHGTPVAFRHPGEAIGAGIVYMPPDRKNGGLWLERDSSANIGSAVVRRMPAWRWLRRRALDRAAAARMAETGVRATALREVVGRLSGGNQQRVLLARLLESRPRVLLLTDFTRGVDVRAKAAIHVLVRELADTGIAVCVTSADLEELLDVADRIVCMRAGRIVADRPSGDFDKLSLLALASTARSPGDFGARNA